MPLFPRAGTKSRAEQSVRRHLNRGELYALRCVITGVCRELGFLIDTSAMAECIQTQISKQKKEHAQARAKRAENQKIDDMTNLEPGWSFKYTFNQ